MKEKINSSLFKLLDWMDKNGWAGYDPFSVLETPLFLWLLRLPKVLPLRILRHPFFVSLQIAPGFWLEALNCKKQINAKGMGLFAKAYLNLYEKTKNKEYLEKAKECLNWLENNISRGYSGSCWGYPFDWQSHVFYPKGTPSGVVTSTVGGAFWQAYKLLGEAKYLEICESICNFFMGDLNIDRVSKDRLCFSYTPLDKAHCHNANLFVAEYLIKIGQAVGKDEYVRAGIMATNYTIADQQSNGSWYYHVSTDPYGPFIDGFHTGFILRMLYSIHELTGRQDVLIAAKKGFDYYLENLFDNNILPKYLVGQTYPIDIHACSEGILCLSKLGKFNPLANEVLKKLLNWTIENMQDRDGSFYYMKKKYFTVKVPYIRWGQAWMMNSLSEVYQ